MMYSGAHGAVSTVKLPSFPHLEPLRLSHQAILANYTSAYPPYSDYTFASLWCWDVERKIELADLYGNLVIKFSDYTTGEPFYTFYGQNQVNLALDTLFQFILEQKDIQQTARLVPEHFMKSIQRLPDYEIAEDPDNHDYIYRIVELSALRGKKYDSFRGHLNRFLKSYHGNFKLLDLTDAHTWQTLLQFNAHWQTQKEHDENDVSNDMTAVERLREIAAYQSWLAVGVYIDGILRAYSINEFQDDYAICLFTHADKDFKGIYHFIDWQVLKWLHERGLVYWNLQQDLGISGLRTAKQLYRPAFFLKKYTATRKSDAVTDSFFMRSE